MRWVNSPILSTSAGAVGGCEIVGVCGVDALKAILRPAAGFDEEVTWAAPENAHNKPRIAAITVFMSPDINPEEANVKLLFIARLPETCNPLYFISRRKPLQPLPRFAHQSADRSL